MEMTNMRGQNFKVNPTLPKANIPCECMNCKGCLCIEICSKAEKQNFNKKGVDKD